MSGKRLSGSEQELGELMRKAQDGDAVAYRHLLHHLKELMERYAKAFNSRARLDDGDWEDAVQEILIAIHEKRRTYDPAQPFLPWVFAIARYKLIDRLRSRRRFWARTPNMDDFEIEDVADFSHLPTAAHEDFRRLLAELPEKQQQVLVLVKLQGLSIAETAEKLGLSESDVKVSVHRGVKALRSKWDGTGGLHG